MIEHEKFPITITTDHDKMIYNFRNFMQLLNSFISFLDRIHVWLTISGTIVDIALIFIAK